MRTFRLSDSEFDRKHIWHPYTSMRNPIKCYPITEAKGFLLKLADGRFLVDGMSSWWAAIHGYNHPRLNKALQRQILKMSHIMFGGITHLPAVQLCKKLLKIVPEGLECIFLTDSGSVAVEVAMKMALQYWLGQGEKRHYFLSLKHAYHGDTFGAMSVCDPHNSMHSLWKGYFKKHYFSTAPKCQFNSEWNNADFMDFERIIIQYHSKIAAIILEPIVQAAGGMRFYHFRYLQKVREYCDKYNVLMIADEIATGFGRTGKLFACEYATISPDILCLGKALTGGTITLAGTLTTRKIANKISDSKANCLMHGPTFMANPLACSVAIENLNILQEGTWKYQVKKIEKVLKTELLPLRYIKGIIDIRILGAIGVIETSKKLNITKLQEFFVNQGVWIRPFGKLIYITPPYIISEKGLKKITNSIAIALENLTDYNL